jgi:predicted transcriptional regulator
MEQAVNDDKKRETDMLRLWQRLEETEREIVLYFAHAAQPVSVDALSSLSDASAVTVLNVMERLRRKGFVAEKKGFGKGIFFLRDTGLAAFVKAQISDDQMRRVARRIVDYSAESQAEGTDRILFLADLYRKLGDSGEGLDLIKNAYV